MKKNLKSQIYIIFFRNPWKLNCWEQEKKLEIFDIKKSVSPNQMHYFRLFDDPLLYYLRRSLKAGFSEIRVRTWVQVVFLPKKTALWLADLSYLPIRVLFIYRETTCSEKTDFSSLQKAKRTSGCYMNWSFSSSIMPNRLIY